MHFFTVGVILLPIRRRPISNFFLHVSRQRKLLRVVEKRTNKTVARFKVAVGKSSTRTPGGKFLVDHVNSNPFYRLPDKSIIPPGPNNPIYPILIVLQKHGKRINQSIHGTKSDNSIGTAASGGCIRLKREDASTLARLVKPGMRVKII